MDFHPTGRRLLAVVAHPDDVEFTYGGTIARWIAEGGEVYYLICTDGAAGGGHPSHTADWLRETREREQRDAAAFLGVRDVFFLRYRDGELLPSLELRLSIARCIRQVRPDTALILNPVRHWGPNTLRGNHPDHLAAGEAALAALYPGVGNAWTFTELLAEGLQPHTVPEILIVNTEKPDYAVDISTTRDTKIAAIRQHVSQVGDREIEERIRGRAAMTGEAYNMPYAEAFLRLLIDW